MLRRIRGIIRTALTWGVLWSPLGVGESLLFRHAAPSPTVVAALMLAYGVVGGVSGAIFAIALVRVGRRAGSIDALSIPRTAVLGALGGLAVQVLLDVVTVVTVPPDFRNHIMSFLRLEPLAIGGVLGALSAAGSLALARRAPKEREKLGSGNADFAMPRKDGVEATAARP